MHRKIGGKDSIYKVTFQKKAVLARKWQNDSDAFELLGSSDDSEEHNRSKGGANWRQAPV